MIYYFAYGHNTNTAVMKGRIPGAVCVGPAILPHHKLVMAQYAAVVKAKGHVAGVLWKISKEDLKTLDHYEEVYTHHRVRVKVNGVPHMAYVYYMNPGPWWHRPPSPTYVDHVAQGYAEHRLEAR